VIPITGALAAAMLAAAPGALAQVTSGQEPSGSPWPNVRRDTGSTAALADTAYIRQVIRGNLTEVALGRLAESRASESAVEEFAERMVSEHSSMNQQWGPVARNNGMRAEVTFGEAEEPSVERLEDEHAMPEGWEAVPWKTRGGYGCQDGGDHANRREVVWFSPHCLRQPTLFDP
jgi:putative membrane protein